MFYYLYLKSSGELISDSSKSINAPDDSYAVKSFSERQKGVWNTSALVFDAVPSPTVFPKSSFYKKVGLTLFGKAVAAAKNDIEFEILLEYIKGLDTVDFNDEELIYGVNLLVSKGVWTQAELDGVLDV